MFRAQQLAPLVRRIHVAPADPDAAPRLPDPALGDRGRARLAAAAVEQHPTLAAALGGSPAPLRTLVLQGDGTVVVELDLAEGESLYGAADADASGLDRRGDHVHLVNELHPIGRHALVDSCDLCRAGPKAHAPVLEVGQGSNYAELMVPFVLSSSGWAVYVSNAWHGAELDLGARDPSRLRYTAPGGAADVYLLGPGDPATLAAEFVRLTGLQPLPPTWTLGYLQSRFGYESFDHVHRTLERLAAERLPVHGVVFDVQWLAGHVDLRWDPDHFPEPAANLARIAERGVRTVVITEPGTAAAASNHASGVELDAFAVDAAGEEFDSRQWYATRGIIGYRDVEPSSGALLNVFSERAADWWYTQHEHLLAEGVDAWWLDLNEPEDVTVDVRFRGVDWPAPREELRGEEARNIFAIAQQRLFARRDRAGSDRRPFLLSRAGSAGSQRYGTSPWTGDVGATWGDLQRQARIMLNAGLCGFALTGSDVGGFEGDPTPELFARWMQLGAVSPVFRAHGYMSDREPWSQGAEVLEAIRPALVLRGQLLPTFASWAWEALRAGQPLLRPMLLGPLGTVPGSPEAQAWAAEARWRDEHDQFFLGRLLAAPVLEPGATSRRIHLPVGEWIDVWSGERHAGGGELVLPVTLASLPLFAPAGCVLLADAEPLAGRGRAWPPAELEAWSWSGQGGRASGEFCVDDGVTRMHEQGAYCHQRIVVEDGALSIERLGGAWPASRIRVAVPRPGRLE